MKNGRKTRKEPKNHKPLEIGKGRLSKEGKVKTFKRSIYPDGTIMWEFGEE
ncbi:MAG: hypothetical protein IBX72_14145 [Nitrospirae bacterium]|nr:hypothetical protein [Nitrospirota bacterium]